MLLKNSFRLDSSEPSAKTRGTLERGWLPINAGRFVRFNLCFASLLRFAFSLFPFFFFPFSFRFFSVFSFFFFFFFFFILHDRRRHTAQVLSLKKRSRSLLLHIFEYRQFVRPKNYDSGEYFIFFISIAVDADSRDLHYQPAIESN